MRLKAFPFTPLVGVHWGSDIESLFSSSNGLAITVARELDESGNVQGLKILFDQASAFRLLDEVDLARYWVSEGFARGSHVLEVFEGGWSDEESQLQGYETQRREWLIVTGNSCVSVFSSGEPQVEMVTWERKV
jgi:hypothetical protein